MAVSGEAANISQSLVSERGVKNAEAEKLLSTGALRQGPVMG